MRQVRGSGTLVPVDITWVTAEVGGQVIEVLVEPGVEVTPDTVLLRLHDPQMERSVREAERTLRLALADVERFKISQKSQQLDLKVASATARANFEDSRTQAEIHERLARRELISKRQLRQSKDRVDRNRMLMEVQIERVVNSKETQKLQLEERLAWVSRARDRLAERLEQQTALTVKADVSGTLQQLGRETPEVLVVVTPELVRPMNPDDVPPLPGYDVAAPNDIELYRYARSETQPLYPVKQPSDEPLPEAYYLTDDVQYFPPSPEFRLWNEAAKPFPWRTDCMVSDPGAIQPARYSERTSWVQRTAPAPVPQPAPDPRPSYPVSALPRPDCSPHGLAQCQRDPSTERLGYLHAAIAALRD